MKGKSVPTQLKKAQNQAGSTEMSGISSGITTACVAQVQTGLTAEVQWGFLHGTEMGEAEREVRAAAGANFTLPRPGR